jgi:hypothetical protein
MTSSCDQNKNLPIIGGDTAADSVFEWEPAPQLTRGWILFRVKKNASKQKTGASRLIRSEPTPGPGFGPSIGISRPSDIPGPLISSRRPHRRTAATARRQIAAARFVSSGADRSVTSKASRPAAAWGVLLSTRPASRPDHPSSPLLQRRFSPGGHSYHRLACTPSQNRTRATSPIRAKPPFHFN